MASKASQIAPSWRGSGELPWGRKVCLLASLSSWVLSPLKCSVIGGCTAVTSLLLWVFQILSGKGAQLCFLQPTELRLFTFPCLQL